MTEEKYYKPKVNTTKDLNLKYDGVLSKFIDTSSGAIKVKLESDVIVQRVSHDIYTSWESGIRELIMNEVKACRQAKKDYNADSHIVVKIDPMNKQLVIQGVDSMGMSGQRFGDVVAVLGRSSKFDRSETGMFGMGFTSSDSPAYSAWADPVTMINTNFSVESTLTDWCDLRIGYSKSFNMAAADGEGSSTDSYNAGLGFNYGSVALDMTITSATLNNMVSNPLEYVNGRNDDALAASWTLSYTW